MSKYVRKYYLHRKLRKQGFKLEITTTTKTILVNQSQIDQANASAIMKELVNKYSYGIQILNPILQ